MFSVQINKKILYINILVVGSKFETKRQNYKDIIENLDWQKPLLKRYLKIFLILSIICLHLKKKFTLSNFFQTF